MRILRDTEAISTSPNRFNTEIKENTAQDISNLLTRHLAFAAEYHDPDVGNLLTVFVVEPGDTLATIDRAMDGCFLTNHYSRRQLGDPDFVPPFESLEEPRESLRSALHPERRGPCACDPRSGEPEDRS